MFDLPAFSSVIDRCDIKVFDQCCFGARTTKPTMFLYANCDPVELEGACDHAPQLWTSSDGRSYWSSHEKCIQARNEDGAFATKELAAYPDELNRALIEDGSSSSSYITPKTYYPGV